MNNGGSQNAAAAPALTQFRAPRTVVGRFVVRRTVRSAAFWALAFGGYVASKTIGFVAAYPTAIGRTKAIAAFSNNVGIEVILGPIRHARTVGGYAAWNTLGVTVLIGAVWAMLLATRLFRGEEDAGRAELLLAGQTTARQAAANTLAGLFASLMVFYIVLATTFSLVSRVHGVGFNVAAGLFFALAIITGIIVFLMVGAVASQLMPTRGRAASLSVLFFGVCYLVRAVGDITSAHWLLNLSPLGWIEKLQPLSDSRSIWLVPLFGLIIVLAALTIFLAGRRDLSTSIIADRDTAKPRVRLLNTPFGLTLRLTWANTAGWMAAFFTTALIFGLLTKTTAQVLSQSTGARQALHRLAHQSQLASATAFLGVVFLLQMIMIMAYAASNVAAVRRDEAEGYVDNFLVGPVSRWRWLSARILLAVAIVMLAGVLTCVGVWASIASQHLGLAFHTLLSASINAIVPAIFAIGIGVLTFGFRPRLTSLMAYGVLAWSFLIEMVSSGINLNHWIIDTSILSHIAFAPAASPRWTTNAIITGLAIGLCIVGAVVFSQRDLQSE